MNSVEPVMLMVQLQLTNFMCKDNYIKLTLHQSCEELSLNDADVHFIK